MPTLPRTFVLSAELCESLARVIDVDADGDERYPVERLSAAEQRRLVAAGFVPNQRVRVDHDEAVARLRAVVGRLDRALVASAFVAAFEPGTPFEPRAGALMNWVQGAYLEPHELQGNAARPDVCVVCGHHRDDTHDLAEVAWRARDGGGMPCSLSDPTVLVARLEVFEAWPAVEPSEAARRAFVRFFEVLAELPADASESHLRKALGRAKVLGNVRDRASAIETLGTAGVLSTADYPGFFGAHFPFWPRQNRPGPRVETDPPICFWRARDGVNRAAFEHLFGHLHLEPALREREPVARPATTRRATPETELEVGDVFAFRLPEAEYMLAVVTGFCASPSAGPGPIMAFYDWRGPMPVQVDDIAAAGFYPARYALFQMRKRVHRKKDPLYEYVGKAAVVPERQSGFGISSLRELDTVLARVRG